MRLLVIQFTIKMFHIGFMQLVGAIFGETNVHLLVRVQNGITIRKQDELYTIRLDQRKL
jgi:hypothetical protein